jgi:hypothetical protein
MLYITQYVCTVRSVHITIPKDFHIIFWTAVYHSFSLNSVYIIQTNNLPVFPQAGTLPSSYEIYTQYTTVFNIFPYTYLPTYNMLWVTTVMCVTHFTAVVTGFYGYRVVIYWACIEAVLSVWFLLLSLIAATTTEPASMNSHTQSLCVQRD